MQVVVQIYVVPVKKAKIATSSHGGTIINTHLKNETWIRKLVVTYTVIFESRTNQFTYKFSEAGNVGVDYTEIDTKVGIIEYYVLVTIDKFRI